MERVEFLLKNSYPFCKLSDRFPNITFLRWCNSHVDYLEFYGDRDDLENLKSFVPEIENTLGTHLVYMYHGQGSLNMMLSCRCNVGNSTIRIAESNECLWEAPIHYGGGEERITVIAVDTERLNSVYGRYSAIGDVKILNKRALLPEGIRTSFTLSLSSIFGSVTERQLKLLDIALSSGYFDMPRQTNISSLAKAAGVAKSTFQEQLEKAQVKMFKSLSPYVRLYLSITTADSTQEKNSHS
ncbi:MAG: helix-turn-helix domain-containing protein [Thermoplasmataceae archaeon]